jgi:hypothetical protein
MANDLIEFGSDDKVSQAFAWADPHEESLSDGIGGSFGIIGYRGGKWSLRYRGQTFMFTREDGSLSPWLHFVILAQARQKSRTYYPKYKEGSDDPPTCMSIDSIKPDIGVPEPQAATCGICPKNVLYVNQETGRKTTECREHKRLSVLLLASETKRLLGEPLMEPVFMRIPAGSLQNLALMGAAAAQTGRAFYTFVTRASFDPDAAYPKMIFKGVKMLEDNMAPMIKELRGSPQTLRIIGGSGRPALAAPVNQKFIPVAQDLDAGFSPRAEVLELKANPPQAASPPQPPANSVTTAATQPAVSLEGFGPAETAFPSKAAAAPQNVVVDTADPEDADEEMSARIAALMPK